MAAWCSTAGFSGWWKTEVAGLTVVVHLTEEGQGLKGELYSPQQSTMSFPIETVKVAGDTLTLKSRDIRASFKGVRNGNVISGTFRQGGMKFNVSLSPASKKDAVADRPQTPHAPYQYRTREVSLPVPGDTLLGTLTLPQSGPVAGAVVFITGSGTQDRDETIAGHKPFAVIADFLTRAGWATLRCDDRGINTPAAPTYTDMVNDVAAQQRFLASLPELTGRPIGLLGHSQGGNIAMRAAAERPDSVAFVVAMAAPGVNGKDLMVMQNKMIVGDYLTPAQVAAIDTVFALLASDADSETIRPELTRLAAGLTPPATINRMVNSMLTPAYRELVRFDPVPWMKRIKCPVLAINGENDLQVSAAQNLEAIRTAIPQARVISYPGVNHLFQPCVEPTLDYASNPVTISDNVLRDIYAFLLDTFPLD